MRATVELFRNRQFRAFWLAQTVSGLGDSFRRLVFTLWVFQVSGASGLAIAAVTLVEIVPYVLLSPVAGALVDRVDRRALLLICDAARVILTLGLVFAGVTQQLISGFVLLGLITVVSVFGDLANNTVIPKLVDDRELERANALMNVSAQVAFAAGPVLAAIIFARFGPAPAFFLDAVSFAVSFLVLLLTLSRGSLGERQVGVPITVRHLVQDIHEGWNYLIQTPIIMGLLIVTLSCLVNAGINNTVMLFFLTQALGRAAEDVAWLSLVNGVMQVVVGGALVAFAHRLALSRALIAGLVCMLIGSVIIATAGSLPLLVLGTLVTSLGNAPLNVATVTLEQRIIPPGLLGRVRGLAEMSSTVVFLGAAGLAGATVSALGARTLLSVSAAMIAIALAIALLIRSALVKAVPH